MSAFEFELTRSREKSIAVVDISAGSAGVAILALGTRGAAKVRARGISPISLEERSMEQHRKGLAQHILEAGQAALKEYASAGHRAPITAVYAVLHGPWSDGKTVSLSSEKWDEERKITDATISSIAKDSLARLEADRKSIYEASTIRVMLNGYPTADPVGKHAHQVEVTSLVSVCDAEARSAVQHAIETLFPGAAVTWRSFTRAIIALLRESSPYGQYVAIDMRADATQIMSYHFGVLEQRTVAEGISTILPRLSEATPEETLTNLRMLARDACSTEACEKVQKAMALAEPELVRIFGEALGQLATPRRLSNELLLVTHPDLEPWLTPFFGRLDFSQFTMTTLPFNVHTPASIDLTPYVSGDLPDIALSVACALVNIEGNA